MVREECISDFSRHSRGYNLKMIDFVSKYAQTEESSSNGRNWIHRFTSM